jgi:hypothetical protein
VAAFPEIPKNPFTIRLNEWITGKYLSSFFAEHLPDYSPRVTSSYRTPEHNKEVGGVPDSAHVYGLAKDFWIQKGGVDLPAAEVERLFNAVIKPAWDGFSLWEKDHVHVNLDREITRTTALGGLALLVLAGYLGYRGIRDSQKK